MFKYRASQRGPESESEQRVRARGEGGGNNGHLRRNLRMADPEQS